MAALLFALVVFSLLAVVVELSGERLIDHVHEHDSLIWLAEHIFIPLCRACVLVGFILLAYPALFGVNYAPPLLELLSINGRVNNLVNLVFVLPLLLPLLPVVGLLNVLVLPLQGIAAAILLFNWMIDSGYPDLSISYWPGTTIALLIVLLAVITHVFATALSHYLGRHFDEHWNLQGSSMASYRAIVLLLQAPVILLYTVSLGRQLPG